MWDFPRGFPNVIKLLPVLNAHKGYYSQEYRQLQELSYRKQIARQMRTQYVEDIYRPKYYTVTLKSRLR